MYAEKNLADVFYNISIIDRITNISKELEEVHHMRYFFKPEIELMLNVEGFELCACLDCKILKETNYESWAAYFIAVKR